MNYLLIGTVILVLNLYGRCSAEYGFIVASSPGQYDLRLCSMYNSLFAELPDNLSIAKPYEVINKYPSEACKPFSTNFQHNVVIVKRKSCEFALKALNVQNAKASGVIIVSEAEITTPSSNKSMYNEINIPVALISNHSYKELSEFMKNNKQVRIKQYAPPLPPHWDPDSIIMLIIAVSACAIGAWLQQASHIAIVEGSKKHDGENVDEEDSSSDDLDITICQAFIFFGMCSVSILLMYFFYDYLVYVIIAVFCYASSTAIFDLIYPMFKKSACFTSYRLPSNFIPCCKSQPPILGILLYLACAGVAVVWAVYRKASFSWILQDLLGFAFCVFMIKQLKLKSFKLTSTILILFFLYDIFYVFITPLFTKDSQSIMEKVATGGKHGSHEELPMLFKLPKFFSSVYDACVPSSYSMLGYGDIILPGLHVGFCAVWDVTISNSVVKKHVYYIAAVIGYTIGLLICFVALYLMNTGQPALLYLTPCCLLSTFIVAIKRREVKEIWKGIETPKPKSEATESNEIHEEQSLLNA